MISYSKNSFSFSKAMNHFFILMLSLTLSFILHTPNVFATDTNNTIQDFKAEKDKNKSVTISYTILKPVYLFLRVYSVEPSLPLLKQILFRTLRNPGKYTEIWDGKDESGHYIEKWQITTRTEPFELSPETAQEIEGVKAILPNVNALPLNHYLHEPQKCGVFNLKFTNLADGQRLDNIFNTIIIAQNFYGYTKDIGANLRVLIDSKIIYELSVPFSEITELTFNVPVDVSALPPGKHILRAIISDYADHYGTSSVEFIKE